MAADILVAFVMRQHNCQQYCEEMHLNKRVRFSNKNRFSY